jgi:uncharacterized protein GlcG (DUF336 family)
MSDLTLKIAVSLAGQALAAGREISAAPLTVAVLDSGGHLVALQREDGASLLRPQIAIGKAWGAIALGKGSRLLAQDAQQRPAFFAALNGLGQSNIVPAPGGVLIRDQDGKVMGAIGVSGDVSDVDEQVAVKAVEVSGLRADAGALCVLTEPAISRAGSLPQGVWVVRSFGVNNEPCGSEPAREGNPTDTSS